MCRTAHRASYIMTAIHSSLAEGFSAAYDMITIIRDQMTKKRLRAKQGAKIQVRDWAANHAVAQDMLSQDNSDNGLHPKPSSRCSESQSDHQSRFSSQLSTFICVQVVNTMSHNILYTLLELRYNVRISWDNEPSTRSRSFANLFMMLAD